MNNHRRDFIKKVSIAGAAALAVPEMLLAANKNEHVASGDTI